MISSKTVAVGTALGFGILLLTQGSKSKARANTNTNGGKADPNRRQLPSDTRSDAERAVEESMNVTPVKVVDAPPNKPPTPAPTPSTSPEEAARQLFARATLLLATGKGAQLGTSGAPSAWLRAIQRAMQMPTGADDGIYGPETRARGKVLLGKTFPIRVDARAPTTKPVTPSKPRVSVQASKPAAKPAASKPAAKPAAAQPTTVVENWVPREPKQAAQELYDRATALLKAGLGWQLGVRGASSSFVLQAQTDMMMREVDGIYGPATRAAGKQILGKNFPVRK